MPTARLGKRGRATPPARPRLPTEEWDRLAAAFDAMEKRIRRRERELEARQAQLEDVLRALPEGVCVLWGPDGPSLTINPAAEELLDFPVAADGRRPMTDNQQPATEDGRHRSEDGLPGGPERPSIPGEPPSVVGGRSSVVSPNSDATDRSWKGMAMIRALMAGKEPRQVEMVVPHRSGQQVPVLVTVTPTHDRAGRITGSVAVIRDMSAVKEKEARLLTAWEQERAVAEALQQSFVPRAMPEVPEFAFGHDYRPARQRERVGGDFYDAVTLDAHHLAFAIGDVSGKGMEAALYTAMVKNMWRGFLAEDPRPGPLMERLNDALARYMEPEHFVTMVCGVANRRTGELQYAVAGHPAPLLRRTGGNCAPLPGGGMVLGAVPGLRYETEEARVGVGDLLFLYTDGMSELRRDGEMLEVEGLRALLEECPESEPQEVVRCLYERAREWSGEHLHDDIALVALRCRLLAETATAEAQAEHVGDEARGRSAA